MGWRAALAPLRRTRLGTTLAASPLRPQFWRSSFEAARILWFQYGHLQSVRVRESIDGSGEAVPWYTYPAIEFLKQFDFTEKSVFEYGYRRTVRCCTSQICAATWTSSIATPRASTSSSWTGPGAGLRA
jgi:hypothetical protein